MSDYHILDGDFDGNATIYTVIFHFSVPDEANPIGVNYRTALSQDPVWAKTSRVPWIDAAHQTQLDNGEVLEWRPFAFERDPANTPAQDRALLDAKHTALAPIVENKLRNRYKYWGMDRDVP